MVILVIPSAVSRIAAAARLVLLPAWFLLSLHKQCTLSRFLYFGSVCYAAASLAGVCMHTI